MPFWSHLIWLFSLLDDSFAPKAYCHFTSFSSKATTTRLSSGISRSSVNRHPLFLVVVFYKAVSRGTRINWAKQICLHWNCWGCTTLDDVFYIFAQNPLFECGWRQEKMPIEVEARIFCQAFDNVSEACTHSFCCNRKLLSVCSVVEWF